MYINPDTRDILKRREALLIDLQEDIELSTRRTKRYHTTAFLLLLLAVMASGAAGILGLTEVLTAKWVGAIALLPPLLVLLERSFKFEARGRWHKRQKNRLLELKDQLLYQQPAEPSLDQIAEINRKKHKLNHEAQREWDEELTLDWAGIDRGGKKASPSSAPELKTKSPVNRP